MSALKHSPVTHPVLVMMLDNVSALLHQHRDSTNPLSPDTSSPSSPDLPSFLPSIFPQLGPPTLAHLWPHDVHVASSSSSNSATHLQLLLW
jgi:hypothetical protein